MPFRARPVFDVAPGGDLVLGEHVHFERGCRVHVAAGATVRIGTGTRFDEWCIIAAHERIEVGAGCRFGEGAALLDFEPDPAADPERPIRRQPLRAAPVRVGDHAVVGAGAVLGPGTTVADGGIVEAKAVMTAGHPATPDPVRG